MFVKLLAEASLVELKAAAKEVGLYDGEFWIMDSSNIKMLQQRAKGAATELKL